MDCRVQLSSLGKVALCFNFIISSWHFSLLLRHQDIFNTERHGTFRLVGLWSFAGREFPRFVECSIPSLTFVLITPPPFHGVLLFHTSLSHVCHHRLETQIKSFFYNLHWSRSSDDLQSSSCHSVFHIVSDNHVAGTIMAFHVPEHFDLSRKCSALYVYCGRPA